LSINLYSSEISNIHIINSDPAIIPFTKLILKEETIEPGQSIEKTWYYRGS